MSKRKHQVEETAAVVDDVTTEVTEKVEDTVAEEVTVIGHVANCEKLNIRKEPSKNADIIHTVKVGTEVTVDYAESTNSFYKIYLPSGAHGFCMREYIEV